MHRERGPENTRGLDKKQLGIIYMRVMRYPRHCSTIKKGAEENALEDEEYESFDQRENITSPKNNHLLVGAGVHLG